MKIKVKKISYEELLTKKAKPYAKPKKPNIFFRTLLKIVSMPDLWNAGFKTTRELKQLMKKEPCLILMNHSSFIDLEIIESMVYPKPLNIICTTDGFIGKNWLMREIGCIPTKKFTTDTQLVKKMLTTIKKLKSSILLYPEAGYSIDGTSTTLPTNLGKLVKMLKVPVITVISEGAYQRQPLYNELIKRDVKVNANVNLLINKDEIENKKENEIQQMIEDAFTFDNWKWQQENNIIIDHPQRAKGINRFLYKCPHCMAEGNMKGENHTLTCPNCGKVYELTTNGFMKAISGETEINHIPSWYLWERECVKKEILEGKYNVEEDVEIYMMIDTYNVYSLGDGHLIHNEEGFKLTAFDGKLECVVPSKLTYSINADFYWYQIADVITLNDNKFSYFCFPKGNKDIVAKMRLATEELFKIKNNK